jgi:hypothetical protein
MTLLKVDRKFINKNLEKFKWAFHFSPIFEKKSTLQSQRRLRQHKVAGVHFFPLTT